jgi:hypothetical protein
MIDLTSQYVTLDSGTTVLVEANATESGQIFYNVDCPSGISPEEYEQAINKVAPTAERAMRSRSIFG